MINGSKVLAIIPARGGSKRVPKKNLREFRGKTLIEWAYEQAYSSKYIDKIILSTEDHEIQKKAQEKGMHLVAKRPVSLAQDDTSSEDVIRFVINTVSPHEWVVLLQPTSPLRTAEDIDLCIERAQLGNCCVSVNQETGERNGAVYVAKSEWLMDHTFRDIAVMKYRMPAERSLDIDEEEDFHA